jgi:hypothetical protein
VRFVKTSKRAGKAQEFSAFLVIDPTGAIVEEADDLPEDWCLGHAAEGSLQAEGNDRVVAPFRMSANEAILKTRFSRHAKQLPALVGDIRGLRCARRCLAQTHECGFSVALHDMAPHDQDHPSSLLGTVDVEPVSRTLWWEERLPDGGTAWLSEQL